ncbi:MAG TPA: helix-turn-helix transcriptional regulator [Candidatus Limnocylindrales bacterium]|nr:helix-turn-helix transcriptional regulator [Candidatus Limnocylindrales bacterium]
MAVPDHRLAFARLNQRELDLSAYFDAADRLLARFVPFEASCWLSLDPETLLPTGHFSREYGVGDMLALVTNEYLEEDFNKFADLARSSAGVGILSRSTQGDLTRSHRHARFLTEQGFGDGDELRAALRDGDVPWGAVAVHRRRGTFVDDEAELVADLSGVLAHGVRRAIVRSAVGADQWRESVGTVLLRADDTIEAATPPARRWLGELFDSTGSTEVAPLTVVSVAQQARRVAAGMTDELATARLPSRSGGWLRLDASLLEGEDRVAVTISAGVEPGLADLIARAHGLSPREREVTSLTLQGLSTREMAASLKVSPYTVQDHLKSIFDKVGVRSRRELAAQLFVLDVVPRMANAAHDRVPSDLPRTELRAVTPAN